VETTWATWATWLGRSTMCPDVSGCVRMSLCFHKQQQQMFRSVDLLISDDLLTCLTLAPTKRGQSRFLHCLFTLGSTYHHIRARERTKFRSGGLFSLQSRLSRIQLNQYLATQLQKQTQLLDGMGYVYLCVTICCFFSTD